MCPNKLSDRNLSEAHIHGSQKTRESSVDQTHMDQIIDAILQGQYSKACLLFLEATSHEPLHYIPYRTYNRLQKQRRLGNVSVVMMKSALKPASRASIANLDYVENVDETTPLIKGGFGHNPSRNFLPNCQHLAVGDRYSLIVG